MSSSFSTNTNTSPYLTNQNEETNNSNSNPSSYYYDSSGQINWKSKKDQHESSVFYKELDKVDTKNLPNNLFELKQKELEEQRKKQGYEYGQVDSSRFASISSDSNYKETMNYIGPSNEDQGMIGTFSKVVGEAFYKTKDIIWTAKEKYNEYEVNDKLKVTGEKTIDAFKYTGNTIANVIQSDTTKSILNKTGENIGYLWNRIWYGNANNSTNTAGSSYDSNDDNNSNRFINNDDYSYRSSNSRYEPPSNDLSGNINMNRDYRYSSKTYMNN